MKNPVAAYCVGLVIWIGAGRIASAVDYTYDALQRLIRVDYASGASIAYSYDAAGNRLALVLPAAPAGGDFAYLTNNGTITITQYTGTNGVVTIPGTIQGLPVTGIGANAFAACANLSSVTIPGTVTRIGDGAFANGTRLTRVYFKGNAPSMAATAFAGGANATVYYLPGTTGWGTTLGGRPLELWKPQVPTSAADFGVRANQFGFPISWTGDRVIVVEGCADLAHPVWLPLQTNTFSGDSVYFGDPQWTNYPARLYRIRSP